MLEKGSESSTNKRTMQDILPATFFFMNLCGLWPFDEINFFLKIIYILYSIFTIFTMISIVLSLFVVIIFSDSIKDAIVENSFLLFTLLNGWVKGIILIRRRNHIKLLLRDLLDEQCQPFDNTEEEIQNKIDKEAKKITIIHATSVGIAVTSMYFAVLSKNGDERIKILNCWRPYNLRIPLHFWLTWFHEFIGHMVISIVHISADTIVPGLMIQICCQIKFLRHRLNDLPFQIRNFKDPSNSSKITKQQLEGIFISKTVIHHCRIFQFAEKLKTTFMEILVSQFSLSLIIICFSGYKISNQNTLDYANLLTLYSYIVCILIQLFLYCWFGNQLMLCSNNLQDGVYETDWLFFENTTKKSLLIIMIRTGKPILISAGSIILVNLSSFVIILKASYTAYNVLQHSE